MKKFVSLLLIFISFTLSCCEVLASSNNIRVTVDPVQGYQYKTVLKHYQPYSIGLVNDNATPVLFSTKSEIKYIDANGKEYIFPDSKLVYRKSRKRDVGRYFWVSLPCAAIGGGIIGITFGLGIILGLGVAFAGVVPVATATKYNSKVATDIYVENKVPLSLEPKQFQMIYVFLPKKEHVEITQVVITNLSLKDSKPFDITIPIGGGLK